MFKIKTKLFFNLTASLLFLFAFSTVMLFHLKLDADTLYPFSFAKDLLTGIPISGWYFPGPLFIVPDVMISIPIVFLFKKPVLWGLIFGFTQILTLIFFVSYFTENKKNFSFYHRVIYAIFLVFGLYAVGHMLFHNAWSLSTSKIFCPVNHASTSLAALLVFFLTKPDEIVTTSYKKIIFLALLVYSFTFSDPFFCLFFLCLNLPYLFTKGNHLFKNKRWMIVMLIIACTGTLGVLNNMLINPGLLTEFLPHTASNFSLKNNIYSFWENVRWYGISLLYFVPIGLAIIVFFLKKFTLLNLLLGIIFLTTVCALFGLFNVDESTLRYVCIYFPVLLYVLFELLPATVFKIFNYSLTFFLILLISTVYLFHTFYHKPVSLFSMHYPQKINFQKLTPEVSKSILVATYWSAKVLFENTNRTASLVQIGSDLTPYHWIVNPAWRYIVKKPNAVIVDTNDIAPSLVNRLKKLPHTELMHQKQLLRFVLNQKIIKLIPALNFEDKKQE